ncbi:hypothetical protein [Parasitella parasitica]|uniref:Ndc10 domain-containing protein n=1 Tax=Parasitella parasitica TaxID=35722 RepID=A0A0B7MYZ7_9FUNG|nr:hypothetical protein [Parasitella parasitica]
MLLLFYLFYRQHIAGDPFPQLSRSRDDLKTSISYDHHLNCIKEAFKAVGAHSKAKSHAMRSFGSRMAEIFGTSEVAIQRLGLCEWMAIFSINLNEAIT